MDAQKLFDDFCRQNRLEVTLSFEMPDGYETAYGTYDVTSNTLFFNLPMLDDAPEYEAQFYLCHELRHAQQYLYPQQFEQAVVESLPYVILYNGTCFKLCGKECKGCVLPGSEEYFCDVYLRLPYELDANAYAYRTVKFLLGESEALDKLYSMWLPKKRISAEEYRKLFEQVDVATEG